jgi:putative transposase
MSSHVLDLTKCTLVSPSRAETRVDARYNVGMIVTYQYRLYPTQEQAIVFDNAVETLRHLYNGALAERIDAYQYEGTTIGFVDQANQLPLLKVTAQPLAELNAQVAQDCLKRLDKAYQAFFRRVKRCPSGGAGGRPAQSLPAQREFPLGLGAGKTGEKVGFPRFKGIGRYRSFCYPQWKGSVKLLDGFIRLSKIGDIAIRLHRPLQGTPKTCTILARRMAGTPPLPVKSSRSRFPKQAWMSG